MYRKFAQILKSIPDCAIILLLLKQEAQNKATKTDIEISKIIVKTNVFTVRFDLGFKDECFFTNAKEFNRMNYTSPKTDFIVDKGGNFCNFAKYIFGNENSLPRKAERLC